MRGLSRTLGFVVFQNPVHEMIFACASVSKALECGGVVIKTGCCCAPSSAPHQNTTHSQQEQQQTIFRKL